MIALLPLPRLVFGTGALSSLAHELSLFGVRRPLLLSDRGLERAGLVACALKVLPDSAVPYLDVPANPTALGADSAYATYRDAGCDGVVALGGGSVIDTAKIVAALAAGGAARTMDLLGTPELIGPNVAPLIAIPTTVGTGSESSPATGLHPDAGSRTIGTRSSHLVPRVAICDPDLARTLPPPLIAATGIDALSGRILRRTRQPGRRCVGARRNGTRVPQHPDRDGAGRGCGAGLADGRRLRRWRGDPQGSRTRSCDRHRLR